MTNEIELYQKISDPISAIQKMGQWFASSGMFGADSESKGAVLAMACLTERRSPLDIIRTYHIVDGKLSKKAMAALAEFRNAGGKHRWSATGEDGVKATGEFTFEGQTLTVSFSMEDAKKQGLVKPNSAWLKTPGNMLRARVSSNAIGMLCPEIFAGGDVEEESPDPKQIILAPSVASSVAAAPKPESGHVVDAEVVPESEKAQAASPASKPISTASKTAAPSNSELPTDLVDKIEAIIPSELAASAVAFMAAKGMIRPGDTHLNLPVERANAIIANPTGFLNRVKEFAAKPATV